MQFKFPNIRHLNAFHEVVKHGRISIAADHIFLSQPAITQAIAKLEKFLKVELFERQPEGMFVTEAGEIFARRVELTLNHLKAGAELARRKALRAGQKSTGSFYNKLTAVQLRTLVAMSEVGNFSQAARNIGTSQPSVHRTVKDLEKLAEIRFFETTRSGISLTLPGEILVHQIRLAAAELQQGYYEISEYLGQDSTRIRIGSLPLSRTSILPGAIEAFLSESGKGIQIVNIDGPYAELLRALRFGELDFIIGALRNPEPADDVVQEPLFEDPLAIVAGAGHPLTKRTRISLEDTLDYPWIAPPKVTPSGSYLFEMLRIPELPKTPVRIVTSSLVLVRGLLARGDYVTIMSLNQMKLEHELGLIAALPVELENNMRPIGLTFRKGWHPTPAQSRFLDLVRDQCHDNGYQ